MNRKINLNSWKQEIPIDVADESVNWNGRNILCSQIWKGEKNNWSQASFLTFFTCGLDSINTTQSLGQKPLSHFDDYEIPEEFCLKHVTRNVTNHQKLKMYFWIQEVKKFTAIWLEGDRSQYLCFKFQRRIEEAFQG